MRLLRWVDTSCACFAIRMPQGDDITRFCCAIVAVPALGRHRAKVTTLTLTQYSMWGTHGTLALESEIACCPSACPCLDIALVSEVRM